MRKFYADGIRFGCKGDGRCCLKRGDYGSIGLSLKDRRRLAAYLGISTARFTRLYAEKEDGVFYLRQPGSGCPFLEKKRCGVYGARPEQCRTWPFWPENMSPGIWRREVVSYCPGVGRGKLYTAVEIERILRYGERALNNNAAAHSTPPKPRE